MIEDVITEIKQRQIKQPISQDQYNKWRRMNVTKRLFEDIELFVIDNLQDYLPTDSVDKVALQSMLRQGRAEMAEHVLDWVPSGVVEDDDED